MEHIEIIYNVETNETTEVRRPFTAEELAQQEIEKKKANPTVEDLQAQLLEIQAQLKALQK